MTRAVVGIIGGGRGVYELPGLENIRRTDASQPLGRALRRRCVSARSGGRRRCFCPATAAATCCRLPAINYRANIDALKRVGVTDIVSVSACGSFKSELYPGLLVLVDQFVDRTFARESSFFGNGCVAHVSMAHPVAPKLLRAHRGRPRRTSKSTCVKGGTYVCMEGPQFSTYAESLL